MVHDMYSRTSQGMRDGTGLPGSTAGSHCLKKKDALLGCFLIRSDDNNFV